MLKVMCERTAVAKICCLPLANTGSIGLKSATPAVNEALHHQPGSEGQLGHGDEVASSYFIVKYHQKVKNKYLKVWKIYGRSFLPCLVE